MNESEGLSGQAGRLRQNHLGDFVGDLLKKTGQRVENAVDRKKEDYFREAEERAEFFIGQQMNLLSKRVDQKMDEIQGRVDQKLDAYEKRLDEQIHRELRIKIRILKYTFLTACGIMAIGLLLQYFTS